MWVRSHQLLVVVSGQAREWRDSPVSRRRVSVQIAYTGWRSRRPGTGGGDGEGVPSDVDTPRGVGLGPFPRRRRIKDPSLPGTHGVVRSSGNVHPFSLDHRGRFGGVQAQLVGHCRYRVPYPQRGHGAWTCSETPFLLTVMASSSGLDGRTGGCAPTIRRHSCCAHGVARCRPRWWWRGNNRTRRQALAAMPCRAAVTCFPATLCLRVGPWRVRGFLAARRSEGRSRSPFGLVVSVIARPSFGPPQREALLPGTGWCQAASSSEPPTSVGLACRPVGAWRRHLVKHLQFMRGHRRPSGDCRSLRPVNCRPSKAVGFVTCLPMSGAIDGVPRPVNNETECN